MVKLVWPLFILLVLAQWWVPGQMIWQKESVLRYGTPYKFRSAPVDPGDPFRGRYIVLNFEENTFKTTAGKKLHDRATVYVTFANGKNGFAAIKSISTQKPTIAAYLETTILYIADEPGKDSSTVHISYPFEKFYMEEYKAPEAERRYNQNRRDTARNTFALVYLLNGDAVVKDVFINDTSLLQTLHNRNALR